MFQILLPQCESGQGSSPTQPHHLFTSFLWMNELQLPSVTAACSSEWTEWRVPMSALEVQLKALQLLDSPYEGMGRKLLGLFAEAWHSTPDPLITDAMLSKLPAGKHNKGTFFSCKKYVHLLFFLERWTYALSYWAYSEIKKKKNHRSGGSKRGRLW